MVPSTLLLSGCVPLLLACATPGPAPDVLDASGTPDPTHPALYAWFDAGDGVNGRGRPEDGAPVTAWLDHSGNGHDLVRTSDEPDERPTFLANGPNGWPAVRFDGDDYLWGDKHTEFGTLAGGKTIFWVGRIEVADGGYVFDGTGANQRNAAFCGQTANPAQWVLYSGTDPVTGGPLADLRTTQVHSVVFDEGYNEHWIDGASIQTGSSAMKNLGGLVLGARYSLSQRLSGDIAELLVYDAVLAPAERRAIERWLLAKHPHQAPPAMPAVVDVFTTGDGVYGAYRIPSLITTASGALLAFAEGRASLSDHAANDIVLRRSVDGGATWGPLVVLHDDGGNSLNNPCAVQLAVGPHAGRILLMYQRYPEGCHESCVEPGYDGPKICRAYLMHSDDDGQTWSAPREVTSEVKPPEATSIAGGPGIAIQKRRPPYRGRVVFPFNRGPSGDWKVFAVWSDDGGDTWTWGAVADDTQSPGNGNEVQVAELVDGSLLLNSRSHAGTKHRKISVSADGGATWSPLVDHDDLIEPQCMASTLRASDPLDGEPSVLLYAGPKSTTSRVNGTLFQSLDEGRTWQERATVYPGPYAYSVLARLPGGAVGCLFERDGYAAISLVRLSID